jgi:hypothetical protein
MNEFENQKENRKIYNKKTKKKDISEEQIFYKKSIKQFKKRKEELYEKNSWEDIEEWENYKR